MGRRSRIALSTVNPPTPESNIPIGRSSLMCPPGLNVLDRQTVTEARHRLEGHTWVGQIRQLAPETLDVRVHGVIVEVVRVAPHLVAKLGARENAFGIRGKHCEEVELGHRQRDLFAPDLDPPRGVVDLQPTDGKNSLATTA